MPLLINLRHLENKDLDLHGDLEVEELDLNPLDELIHVGPPLEYRLAVQKVEQALLVRGSLQLKLRCECARCLKPFDYLLRLGDWTCLVPLEGEDAAPVVSDCVDLTPYLREDTVLAFPQHPLCESGCGGLAASPPKAELNSAASAWDELNRLKL